MKWRWLWTLGFWCCGCDCEPGDYNISVNAREVVKEPVSGTATIQHREYEPPSELKTSGVPNYMTVFTLGERGSEFHTDLHGIPPDVFADGAEVFAILKNGSTPVPGTDALPERMEVTIYDLGGPSPSTLRASAWRGSPLPVLQGAKLEPDGIACETKEADCTQRYTRVKVTLDSGESLSVAPGEQRASGRIRMGNGGSIFEAECGSRRHSYFEGYLAISR
jgi:hypothetical protein